MGNQIVTSDIKKYFHTHFVRGLSLVTHPVCCQNWPPHITAEVYIFLLKYHNFAVSNVYRANLLQ